MKVIFRILYSLLLFIAGVGHFTKVEGFVSTMPEFIPMKKFLVQFTGILEIIFSMTLWIKREQSLTSKLLAIFMVAVFPANIHMAVNNIPFKPGAKPNKLMLWLRLPLQVPLIFGALKLGRK